MRKPDSASIPAPIHRAAHRALVLTGALCAAGCVQSAAPAQVVNPGQLTVGADKPGAAIPADFYGLMTEEINYSYDGGLYGELVRNRSFLDDPNAPAHWSLLQDGNATASMALDPATPLNPAQPVSLKLAITAPGKRAGIANDGYWGFPVRPNTIYIASFFAKTGDGFDGPVTLSLESPDGATTFATATVAEVTGNWKKYSATLTTGAVKPTASARFVISAAHPGTLWLDFVSLFPPTYKDRPNGNRPDLMQLLAGMHPGFLRFPGGNYLEGGSIPERFDWKKTLGDVSTRPGHHGPWGYRSTDGMGLLEFLEWCEDLHMEPVLAVYGGFSLNRTHVNPGPDLQPYVQDALDEIQYLTGDATTTWGARRIADGHPAPFPLHYVEIGNEDFFDRSGSYSGRYAQFYDAIKAQYPDLQLIATAEVSGHVMDLRDDHFYRPAGTMAEDSHHYDTTDRKGPKIFVGEWASQTNDTPWERPQEKGPTPTLYAALGDAAWLTGLERNADIVKIQCYAPLLVNVNPGGRQWSINLIGYDALRSFGSPSYYVQQMFASNRGDQVLPVDIVPPTPAAASEPAPTGDVGVGTWNTQAQFKDVTVTGPDGKVLAASDFTNGSPGWTLGPGHWTTQDGVLAQDAIATDQYATFGDPTWSDYTLNLKAQKTGGQEGFLILVHAKDSKHYVWWNLGGWNDSHSGLEANWDGATSEVGASAPVTIATGRWYDIRIEVQGPAIRCYLDGKLITSAVYSPGNHNPGLFATASRDAATHDVILKVVNMSAEPAPMHVTLSGETRVAPGSTLSVLTGAPDAMNSVDQPQNVAPRSDTLPAGPSTFTQEFPAYSVSVLRLKTK